MLTDNQLLCEGIHFIHHIILGAEGRKAGSGGFGKAWSASLRNLHCYLESAEGRGGRLGRARAQRAHGPQSQACVPGHGLLFRACCLAHLSRLIPLVLLSDLFSSLSLSFAVPPNAPGSFLSFCQKRFIMLETHMMALICAPHSP